ncbi:phage portal protein [Clostridium botulinum]|nr:phage portal protein [Clostridium botulinum]MBO0560241.1 phage portal protein [Clostridium botulinum]
MGDIKQTLLKFTNEQKKELEKIKANYYFYHGAVTDKDKALLDEILLGQSWINADDLDYIPSQVIDNKIKPLIHKQARFFLGKEPVLLFKPRDSKDKSTCEELRVFIDDILNGSQFWSETMKAFRLASVTKRVLLRMEANPEEKIRLYYHDVNDFNYELDPKDSRKLLSVTFVRLKWKIDTTELWNRYTYKMSKSSDESLEETCLLTIEAFNDLDLENPIETKTIDTKLSKIPCWIMINEQDLMNKNGKSDITDLKPLQNSYNQRLSDFNDALRFLMFGQTVVIDATEGTVNACKIAPNALMALVSIDGKQASAQRVESSFSNAEPVKMFLDILDKSMHEKLSIPTDDRLKEVPSAKTIKYIYNDLIARSEEKWHDWEPNIRSMLRLLVEACSKFKCYDNWNEQWNNLLFSIVLNKNYPIPEDEEDKKRLAIEEVNSNVRSHRSYIKDFSDNEDYKEHFDEVIEDITTINTAEQDQFLKGIDDEASNCDGDS